MADGNRGRILVVTGSAEGRTLAARLPGALTLSPGALVRGVGMPGAGVAGKAGMPRGRIVLPGDVVAVIEAAHPCDVQTAQAVAAAAARDGIAHLQLVRPVWRPSPRDHWHALRDLGQVAQVVPVGARVFATVGRGDLAGMAAFRGTVLARVTGPVAGAFPLRHGRFVPGEGPFSVAGEIALLRALRVDWLVLRNAGGDGAWPKVAAARRLGLPVAMLDRPRRPQGARVRTAKEALEWLDRILAG